MFRRDFIQRFAAVTSTGLAATAASRDAETKSVTYNVRGFTCVTCAVGLEVLLRQQKGVVEAKASYKDSAVAIVFRPENTSEDSLKSFINRTGFTVEEPDQI